MSGHCAFVSAVQIVGLCWVSCGNLSYTVSRQSHGEQQATGRRHIALLAASGAISHIALLLSSVRAMMTSLVR